MPIVDFEQDPEAPLGTGNFRDERGRVMYLHDPDTASQFVKTMRGSPLKKQVADESAAIAKGGMGAAAPAAQPDQRLAMNDTGAPVPVGNMSLPPPPMPPTAPVSGTDAAANMSVTPAEVQSLSPEAAVSAVTKVTAPAAKPAAPVAPTGPQKLVETVSKVTGSGLPISGVSTTRNRSVVRGRDAAAVAQQVGAEEAAGASLDTEMLSAAEKKDAATGQMLDTQSAAVKARQAREQQRIEDAKAQRKLALEEKAKLEDALKKNDESLDPERFINNMSTGKTIAMALLAAINGGFGAIIGQKENGVMRVIDQKIDQDIERQKQEIASGRIRIGNQIHDFMQQGHDAKTAEALARDRLDAAVDQLAEIEAKRVGAAGENLTQTQLLVKQRQEQRAARRGELLAQKEDKIQEAESTVVQREAPKPAGAGLDDLLKKIQLESALLKLGNERTSQMNAIELSKRAFGTNEKGEPVRLLTPDEAKEVQSKVAQVGDALTETSGAVAMSKALVEALGGRLDETTGKAIWPDDLTGAGPVDKAGGWLGVNPVTGLPVQAARAANLYRADIDKARDAQEALKQQVTSMITGANSSLKQDQTFGSMVGGDFSNQEQVKENVQNWLDTLFSTRKQHMARLGPEGMRVMQANQSDAQRGNDAPALVPHAVTGAPGTTIVPPEPNMSVAP